MQKGNKKLVNPRNPRGNVNYKLAGNHKPITSVLHPDGPLSAAHQAFVEKLLADPLMNAAKAAIEVGYSKKSATAIGAQLLSHPKIRKHLAQAIKERSERNNITADYVLLKLDRRQREIEALNRLDASVIYNKDGTLKPIHQWPKAFRQKQMIKRLECTEEHRTAGGKTQVRTYLKKIETESFVAEERKNLELLGRHTGVGAFRDASEAPIAAIKIQIEYIDPPKVKPNGHLLEGAVDEDGEVEFEYDSAGE